MIKKIKLIIVFLAINFSAQSQLMWQGFPITVSQVYVNATDSYLKYSVYDSLTNATVIDSTPIYNYPIYYNNSGALLTYTSVGQNNRYYIFYNHNTSSFHNESIDASNFMLGQSSNCYAPAFIYGNFFLDWACDATTFEVYFLVYANIIMDNLDFTYYISDEGLGFNAFFSEGWFHDFENGDPFIPSPGWVLGQTVQPGMSGNCGNSSYSNQMITNVFDGIMVCSATDIGGFSKNFCSNDGGGSFFISNTIIDECKNGVVWYSDSITMYIASDDAVQNQWVQTTFNAPYLSGRSTAILKDRVFVFAPKTDTISNVYFAVYNFPVHTWVVDSVLSNQVNNLAINNGTITWSDSSGTQFTRGYSDTLGWGNFNTPLQIEFSLENLQSPTNGNLVYVRNYTIGSDSIMFDFGDGYTTTKKSESHLFRNPNGTYRTSSSFNHDICLYAQGQSNCKTVSFVTSTHNIELNNAELNIRYANNKGVFVIDNKSNKKLLIQLYDTMGQLVKQFYTNKPLQEFDLLNSANGFYIMRALSADNSIQKSFKVINSK